MEKQSDARYNIRVLDRAFRILSLLSDGKPRTPIEISEEIELSPSTTFRLLSTLAYYNYVKKIEPANQYQLGLACLELASAYQASNSLRQVALPELEALRDDVKETVHLCVLDNMEVVYIEKLPGLHAVGIMSSRVGGRAPSYCTGVGKVLLAYQKPEVVRQYLTSHRLTQYTDNTVTDVQQLMQEFEIIRQRGYSFDRGEHEHEVRCIAAPIFDISGKTVAALSISGPDARMEPLEKNEEMIQKALKTAADISRQLGYQPGKQKSKSS
ncbi:MAG: IclR family transcriptional regulator [Chloroflexota bacterium]